MKSLKQLKNIKGKIVLLRVDFNVPIRGGKILDSFRIQKALPTINFLRKKGAKVVLISHLGEESGKTLKPVANYLSKASKLSKFSKLSELSKSVERMKDGEVVLVENLRLNPGEEKNSPAFAKKLASFADVYVNDAFPVCHRAHASIVGVPKYLPAYAGFQLESEVRNLKTAEHPGHPFLFILGGAKFETKIPLITKYLKRADGVFIGGALMNNFFMELGLEVGESLVDKKNFGLKKLMKNSKLILPVDILVKAGSNTITKKPNEVKKGEFIVDIGRLTTQLLINLIRKSKFVLMNGPMGNYEKGFGVATEKILKALAESRAKVIIGGGDTVACYSKLKDKGLKIRDNFFVSSGGGATLEFLAKGTLPGIKALK